MRRNRRDAGDVAPTRAGVKVVLSKPAEADLLDIAIYIAGDNPTRARTFVREPRAKARQIGTMPRAFALVPGYEHRGLRRSPYRDYLNFYRIDPGRIVVIHILHGARHYDAVLASAAQQ